MERLTALFAVALTRDPQTLEALERNVRFALSAYQAMSREDAIFAVVKILVGLEIQEEKQFYTDVEWGAVQCISNFEKEFFNLAMKEVNLRSVAERIVDKIWVEGKSEYRFEGCVLQDLFK